ncbi:hypothetical protein [Streptomyces sp. NPDC048623]|uniref:hypothetical protein n=1 Tax=Streptomyces sp. NPDC048623 TaxID=3155761 RepID=UPI00343EAC29
MRSARPTPEQLERNFVRCLAGALNGQGVRSGSGLDSPTEDALWAIASAHPEVPLDLVDAARAAFAGQLDGSNARHWHEDLARGFAERRASEQP